MNNPYIIAFELLELILFLLCLGHAVRTGRAVVWQLLAGIAYGILLELLSLRQAQSYDYEQFSLMVFDVPLAIGIAWGNQLYAMRLFTDTTDLPEWSKPVSDALLNCLY